MPETDDIKQPTNPSLLSKIATQTGNIVKRGWGLIGHNKKKAIALGIGTFLAVAIATGGTGIPLAIVAGFAAVGGVALAKGTWDEVRGNPMPGKNQGKNNSSPSHDQLPTRNRERDQDRGLNQPPISRAPSAPQQDYVRDPVYAEPDRISPSSSPNTRRDSLKDKQHEKGGIGIG